MLGTPSRRPDIRNCTLIAAAISACCVVALELAGNALTRSYTGLDGKLAFGTVQVAGKAPFHGTPASSSLP
jgi:hypothetical protein